METVSKMKNPQLYIALYALDGALREGLPPGPQGHFWTFLVAPKGATHATTDCIRYRIIKVGGWETVGPGRVRFDKLEWRLDVAAVPWGRHDGIVARVLIAEVGDAQGLDDHVRAAWPDKTMYVKGTGCVRTSRDWAQRVLRGLDGPAPGSLSGSRYMIKHTRLADWETVEATGTSFARKVEAESARREGVPTFDLMRNVEVA